MVVNLIRATNQALGPKTKWPYLKDISFQHSQPLCQHRGVEEDWLDVPCHIVMIECRLSGSE